MNEQPFNLYALLFIWMVLIGACSNGVSFSAEGTRDCIQEKVREMQKEQERNPPATVNQYLYNGQVVFYIPPAAGDQMGQLYGEDCQLICRPDGGITGQGDGKCPDFFDQRTEGKVIWQDNRR